MPRTTTWRPVVWSSNSSSHVGSTESTSTRCSPSRTSNPLTPRTRKIKEERRKKKKRKKGTQIQHENKVATAHTSETLRGTFVGGKYRLHLVHAGLAGHANHEFSLEDIERNIMEHNTPGKAGNQMVKKARTSAQVRQCNLPSDSKAPRLSHSRCARHTRAVMGVVRCFRVGSNTASAAIFSNH